MQGLRLTVVDAFTDVAFAGNPAAVAPVEEFPPDDVMQHVAREMNLSETAFVRPRDDGDQDLRWFSPSTEIDLCGHATLAAAHVLGVPVRFHTRSGVLACSDGGRGLIEMDFPIDRPRAEEPPEPSGIEGVRWYGRGASDVLVELDDAAAVRRLEPDLKALAALGSRGVIVTAPSDHAGADFVSRFFAPNAGVPEDPVTGSAHCTLAAFWGERSGKTELVGEQVSARGGTVHMRVVGERVRLAGRAVSVSRVEFLVSPG